MMTTLFKQQYCLNSIENDFGSKKPACSCGPALGCASAWAEVRQGLARGKFATTRMLD